MTATTAGVRQRSVQELPAAAVETLRQVQRTTAPPIGTPAHDVRDRVPGTARLAAHVATGKNVLETRAGEQSPGQDALIADALGLVDRDPLSVCEDIRKYGIESEAARIEIAKAIAAKHGSLQLGYRLANFGITDQNAIVEIAKLAAAKSADTLHVNFDEFAIADESGRAEVAKVAAAADAFNTTHSLATYGLADPKNLDEVATIAAGNWPGLRGLSYCLDK